MTLAERLNRIIDEQKISKVEFARRVGVSRNYIYVLTGNSRPHSDLNKQISMPLAKTIAMEFGYDLDWILNGKSPKEKE